MAEPRRPRRPAAKPEAPCPQAELHTPRPAGYIAWHAWADAMAKTHHQEQCPGCGRWRIWIEGDPLDPDDTKEKP